MVKVVVFDLDDTLISEKEYIKSGYHYIARVLSNEIDVLEDIVFDDLIQLFNKDAKRVFNRLLDKYKIEYTKGMIMRLVSEYRGHYPVIAFYDDVIPCLEKLKEAGIKTGIITDGYSIAQRQKLKAIQADEYFDEIILTDELGRDYWKPHPKAFELMKEKFEVNFDEMIYVGDNPEKDFYVKKFYPVQTVQIIRKDGVYESFDYLHDVTPNFKVDSLQNIWIKFGNGGER